MGAPVGQAGCEGDVRESALFLGGSLGATRSRLAFEGDRHYDFSQQAVTGFLGYRTASGWSGQLAVGAVLDGRLEGDEAPGTFDMQRGFIASLTAARRWTPGGGPWFVSGSVRLGAASTETVDEEADDEEDDDGFLGTDLRLGVTAGRTFADVVSPYLLARAFGGPVFWTIAGEDVTGSDTRHVQLGAGVSLSLRSGLSVLLDVSALGEQSASLAVSWSL